MSTSTIVDSTTTDEAPQANYPRWQTVLFWVTALALFVVAIGMRLYDLGLPFDRDGYDEGVYWQSLLAMKAGHALYQQIFYSQPPFFLLSVFPSFVLFGGTLWSARLGIVLLSLFGLLGAFLLGKVLSGRPGALLALLLLVVDPLYLAESQKLQAEAPSIAFALLAVALAYLWWKHPSGKIGLCWAALTGIAFGLGILSKLLGVTALVPIALLMLARLWQIWQKQPGTNRASLRPLFVGIVACIATMLVILLPFLGSYHTLLQQVITFHIQTATAFGQAGNKSQILHVLTSVLGLVALYGTLTALLRRDWRVIPLIAWLLATAFMLWRQEPLLTHHLVALIPPLIALAIMGIASKGSLGEKPLRGVWGVPKIFSSLEGEGSGSPLKEGFLGEKPLRGVWGVPKIFFPLWSGGPSSPTKKGQGESARTKWATALAVLLILITVVLAIRQDSLYYRTAAISGVDGLVQQEAGIAVDLRHAITPDQLVVTDAQFIAALADRRTPPSLVDTSLVRINGGDLTLQQLIDTTSQPQVHAVLFFSGRFYLHKVGAFHAWVAQHFHLFHAYKPGLELWVR